MICLYEGFNHNEINKLDKIAESFLVPVCYLQQIFSLLFLSSDQIHWLLLNLLTKAQLFFLFEIFLVAFLEHIILNFAHDCGHSARNNALILACCIFANILLF